MKASQLVEALQRAIAEHGDKPLMLLDWAGFDLFDIDEINYDDEADCLVLGTPDPPLPVASGGRPNVGRGLPPVDKIF